MYSRPRPMQHVCARKSVWCHTLSMGRGGRCSLGIRATLPPCKSARCRQAEPRLNRKKILQHIVGNTIGTSLKMYAHLSVCHRALKTRSAREFVATGALAFQRISQPLVWLRKRFLDGQKAADKGKKIVPSSFSTEHHGAWSS